MTLHPKTEKNIRRFWIPLLALGQIILQGGMAWQAQQAWFFGVIPAILLAVNLLVALWLYRGSGQALIGLGFQLLMAGHALIGHQLSPTALTSAAMLLGNLLTFYVGFKLYEQGLLKTFAWFLASYLVLYGIFILWLDNAEALFLMALLGLAGMIRHPRLLGYFWVMVFAFTFAQPYAWETVILGVLLLKILFSAESPAKSPVTMLFLGAGLVLLFCVLFPVAVVMFSESPHNLLQVLRDEALLNALQLTALTATLSCCLLAVFGIPLAYAIARFDFYGKPLLLSLIDVPIIIPQSVAGIALLKVFGKQQIIGGWLFTAFGWRFDGTVLGILMAQIFVAMPFFMRAAIAAFEAVPEKYEMAARTLGADTWQAFIRVTLPLAGRALFLGAILAWARAAGEFGAVLFIAAFPETAPIAAYTRFMSSGLAETAPLVATLLFFSLGMFFLLQLLSRTIPSMNQMGGRR